MTNIALEKFFILPLTLTLKIIQKPRKKWGYLRSDGPRCQPWASRCRRWKRWWRWWERRQWRGSTLSLWTKWRPRRVWISSPSWRPGAVWRGWSRAPGTEASTASDLPQRSLHLKSKLAALTGESLFVHDYYMLQESWFHFPLLEIEPNSALKLQAKIRTVSNPNNICEYNNNIGHYEAFYIDRRIDVTVQKAYNFFEGSFGPISWIVDAVTCASPVIFDIICPGLLIFSLFRSFSNWYFLQKSIKYLFPHIKINELPSRHVLWIKSERLKLEEIATFLQNILSNKQLLQSQIVQLFLQSNLSTEFIQENIDGKRHDEVRISVTEFMQEKDPKVNEKFMKLYQDRLTVDNPQITYHGPTDTSHKSVQNLFNRKKSVVHYHNHMQSLAED